jgi:hypothetical protein
MQRFECRLKDRFDTGTIQIRHNRAAGGDTNKFITQTDQPAFLPAFQPVTFDKLRQRVRPNPAFHLSDFSTFQTCILNLALNLPFQQGSDPHAATGADRDQSAATAFRLKQLRQRADYARAGSAERMAYGHAAALDVHL